METHCCRRMLILSISVQTEGWRKGTLTGSCSERMDRGYSKACLGRSLQTCCRTTDLYLLEIPFQRPRLHLNLPEYQNCLPILVADQVERSIAVVRRGFRFGRVQLVLPNLLPMLASRNGSMWNTGKDMPKSLISEALGFYAHVKRSPSALTSIRTGWGG